MKDTVQSCVSLTVRAAVDSHLWKVFDFRHPNLRSLSAAGSRVALSRDKRPAAPHQAPVPNGEPDSDFVSHPMNRICCG